MAELLERTIDKDSNCLESTKSRTDQPLEYPIQYHPRLCLAVKNVNEKTTEKISFDHSIEICHVNVPPIVEESDLRNILNKVRSPWSFSRVFYISVGLMKHFKIEMISSYQVKDRLA